jgi:hypothetical protein
MSYVVTAPMVFVFLPTAMVIGHRQIHENTRFPRGAVLPEQVKPHIIANLLASGQIKELPPGVETPVA